MNTYYNQLYDFEIDFPDGWRTTRGLSRLPVYLATIVQGADILEEYYDGSHERVNIVVECFHPEPTPVINELSFSLIALRRNYYNVAFSRIFIAEREHCCVTYLMKNGIWLKKYMIVVDGYGYALTASCPITCRSQPVEDRWDGIARSFRLLHPVHAEVTEYNNSQKIQSFNELYRQDLEKDLESLKRVIYL